MRRRAEQIGQTRQRIIEAAVALHGSLGPAATTIAAIAVHAQVTRLTVYRHFPDADALFAACSAHWMSQQRLPDPGAWALVSDPVMRLQTGLADLYRFYRDGADMLASIYHDIAALPQAHRQGIRDRDSYYHQVLAAPFGGTAEQQHLIRGLIGHAASFWTWQSLCATHGLSDQEAVDLMIGGVQGVLAVPSSD